MTALGIILFSAVGCFIALVIMLLLLSYFQDWLFEDEK